MSSNNNGSNGTTNTMNNGAVAGGRTSRTTVPPRAPHWRSRDPAATIVYVVHPAQFRDVVQRLTGAAPTTTSSASASAASHRYAAAPGTIANANANASAPAQCRGGGEEVNHHDPANGNSTRATTLLQMYEECMAWATNDHDEN